MNIRDWWKRHVVDDDPHDNVEFRPPAVPEHVRIREAADLLEQLKLLRSCGGGRISITFDTGKRMWIDDQLALDIRSLIMDHVEACLTERGVPLS